MSFRACSSTVLGTLCIALAACGGGGGDTSSPPQTTIPPVVQPPTTASFALGSGFKTRVDGGANDTFDISGDCTGSANINVSPAAASTFEGVVGVSAAQISTATLNNCSPASSSSTGTTFYNNAYANIGLAVFGAEYAVFQSPPTPLPANVTIGSAGDIVTLITYADSTKAARTGTRLISYSIDADGTSTTSALFNLTTRSYNLANQLLSTQISRYRMSANGTLTLVTISYDFNTTPRLQLLFTKR